MPTGGCNLAVTIAGLFFWGSAGALFSQAPAPVAPANVPEPAPALQVRSQLVLVPVSVRTHEGEPIRGLSAGQFALQDNGVPQTARLEETGGDRPQPISLVVAVQCSRSAEREFPKLAGLETMIASLVGEAPAEVAVVQFGSGSELLSGFTRDAGVRDRALRRIAPCDDPGDTIFDAVDYANALLDDRLAHGRDPDSRRVVLLISETRDHGSEARAKDVIRALGRSNTVLEAVSFSPVKSQLVDEVEHGGPQHGTMNLIPLAVMAAEAARTNAAREFAELSGGEYINFTTAKGFDRGLSTLANQVHDVYLLSFQPHFPADEKGSRAAAAGLHRLSVKAVNYPDATVRHRESYWSEELAMAK